MAKALAAYNPDMRVYELRGAAEAIAPDDCPKVRRFIQQAMQGLHGYTQAKILAAVKRLKPKARDWAAFWAFIEKLIPVILPFIIKGRRAAKG